MRVTTLNDEDKVEQWSGLLKKGSVTCYAFGHAPPGSVADGRNPLQHARPHTRDLLAFLPVSETPCPRQVRSFCLASVLLSNPGYVGSGFRTSLLTRPFCAHLFTLGLFIRLPTKPYHWSSKPESIRPFWGASLAVRADPFHGPHGVKVVQHCAKTFRVSKHLQIVVRPIV